MNIYSKFALCTVITPDYLHKALTLHLSALATGYSPKTFVLTTKKVTIEIPNIEFISLPDLVKIDKRASDISIKYGHDNDRLRWCLKPILLSYILEHTEFSGSIYADSDICFFSPPDKLIQMLDQGGILLTPHWRPVDPKNSTRNFRLNFMDGLFNAGCITASKNGREALDWWAAACESACEKNYSEGLYDDQRYLDLMPIYFPSTVICRHKGFNLADWNLHLREKNNKGQREVPDIWPISMIHFTPNTIKRIEQGGDPMLEPYLNKYKSIIQHAECILREFSDGRESNGLLNQLDETPVL